MGRGEVKGTGNGVRAGGRCGISGLLDVDKSFLSRWVGRKDVGGYFEECSGWVG